MLFDILVLTLSFILAYTIRLHLHMFTAVQPMEFYVWAIASLIALCLVFFLILGLYRDTRDLSRLEEYVKIIKGLTYAFTAALVLTFFFKLYDRSRILIVLYWAVSAAFLILARFGFYKLLGWFRARGWDLLPVAVVGEERKIGAVVQILQQYRHLGYSVVASLALPPVASPRAETWRKQIEPEILARYHRREINGVIISDSVKNYQRILELKAILREYGIPCRHVTEAFDLTGLQVSDPEGLEPFLAQLDEGRIGSAYQTIKRVMDEVLSLAALILTLPVWALIMLAIKIDSPGPMFFKQERVGHYGRKFLIYKFRSMYVEAPRYAKTPRGTADPRVTRVGGFLRRTSLDELPQLLNVISGDMSLVGPRPEMPFVVAKYKPIYRYRFLVKPGLTGLWQVSGRTENPLEENIKYDLFYIKNYSLLLDLLILLRTIPAVLIGKGAY